MKFKLTITDLNEHIIAIINVHHITHEPIKNYTYLWKDNEEISNNYIGIIDNQYCKIRIEKKEY